LLDTQPGKKWVPPQKHYVDAKVDKPKNRLSELVVTKEKREAVRKIREALKERGYDAANPLKFTRWVLQQEGWDIKFVAWYSEKDKMAFCKLDEKPDPKYFGEEEPCIETIDLPDKKIPFCCYETMMWLNEKLHEESCL
jgi:hypothetical protein